MKTVTGAVDVDVVIPTKNRPDQLHVTLGALAQQSYKNFGVIVVDDGGDTAAEGLVPAELSARLSIRFVRNKSSLGPGPSRNRGVSESTAPFIVFLDDDCAPVAELVECHHAALSTVSGPVVSLGPILAPAHERLPVWTHWDADRLEREYTRLGSGQTCPDWTHLFTGNVGVRRCDFLAVGGFDERFARGEDTELGYRLARYGCEFTFDPSAVVFHDSQRTLRSWLAITAASAWFDVEWNRLVPEAARLKAIGEQEQSQHWALRAVGRTCRGPASQWCVLRAAMGAGFVLHALRADRLALPAFSVVRDVTYRRALQEATAADARAKESV
jgi:GT2 family glycosyltransferase